ncbi:MAG: hypothetical protein Ct9H300mP32_5540 [Verrucomicrobiota bacterium]|nr:MAG: hypothetical protein Ct9H300mP32_5540 [Verrucomicrobiota bacterium]
MNHSGPHQLDLGFFWLGLVFFLTLFFHPPSLAASASNSKVNRMGAQVEDMASAARQSPCIGWSPVQAVKLIVANQLAINLGQEMTP